MDINTITQKINSKKERVKKLQSEIKELEAKRTKLENEQIVKAVHELNIPIGELQNVLKELKERNDKI